MSEIVCCPMSPHFTVLYIGLSRQRKRYFGEREYYVLENKTYLKSGFKIKKFRNHSIGHTGRGLG